MKSLNLIVLLLGFFCSEFFLPIQHLSTLIHYPHRHNPQHGLKTEGTLLPPSTFSLQHWNPIFPSFPSASMSSQSLKWARVGPASPASECGFFYSFQRLGMPSSFFCSLAVTVANVRHPKHPISFPAAAALPRSACLGEFQRAVNVYYKAADLANALGQLGPQPPPAKRYTSAHEIGYGHQNPMGPQVACAIKMAYCLDLDSRAPLLVPVALRGSKVPCFFSQEPPFSYRLFYISHDLPRTIA